MTELSLTGIPGELPIGAMAAFGILRICDQELSMNGARLHWRRGSSRWEPVISTEAEVEREDFLARLAAAAAAAVKRQELTWTEQLKDTTLDRLRSEVINAEKSSLDWFVAYASDILSENGLLVATPLDMSVSRQRFPGSLLELGTTLSRDTAAFREALYGPWLYRDDQHSFGWDPTAMRLGAFTGKAPTKMANAGVRAAVWLAFQSLPLFPCFCVSGRLRTRGFRVTGADWEFRWPLWQTPISLWTLKSALASSDLIDDDGFETLRARGVVAIYSSMRFKPNKYITSFRPPVLVGSAE